MRIELESGQSLRITGACVIEVLDEQQKNKPGPKSLPKAKVSSGELHRPIMDFVKRAGPVSSQEIRDHLTSKMTGLTTNVVSWALVELQFENCRRGRNRPKSGPLMKSEHGYQAR